MHSRVRDGGVDGGGADDGGSIPSKNERCCEWNFCFSLEFFLGSGSAEMVGGYF